MAGGVMAGAGVPDELDRLWTPHRLAYVSGAGGRPTDECPFCVAPTQPDDEGLVLARGRTVFAVLNLYPYNPGHLLVCPYRHVPDYTDLDDAETAEYAQFTQTAMRVIRGVSGAHGFNIGMNQGHVAGAGIAAHLHQHVVPRWAGDTNFMPVIGRTKTVPQLLADTRRLLADAWNPPQPNGRAPRKATNARPRKAAKAAKAAKATPAKKATSARRS